MCGTLHDHKLRLGLDPSTRQCIEVCRGPQRFHTRETDCIARLGFFSVASEKTQGEYSLHRCRSNHIASHWVIGVVGVSGSAVVKVHWACVLLGTAPPLPGWLHPTFCGEVWIGVSYKGGSLEGAGVLPPDCRVAGF